MAEHDALVGQADLDALDHPAAVAGINRRKRGAAWWIGRRLVAGLLTLFLISILVFVATQALPSNPARTILGRTASQAQVDHLSERLGLDRPLVTQYTSWLGNLVQGDFGESLTSHQSVTSLIGTRAENSAILVLLCALIAIPIALLLGAYTAARRDRAVDHGFVFTTLLLTAVPEFVLGITLLLLFSTNVLHLLPAVALIPPGESPLAHIDLLILPIATLVLAVVPYLARLVRASMIDVLESEYVQMARLKGMPERLVVRKHALPNSVVPAIQATALTLAYLTGGIVVVEFLFGYPGLGSLLADAVNNRDMPTVQAIVLIFAACYVLFNLVADLLTIYLTPRLRTAGA